MIAYLSGKAGRSDADWVIVDVGGVGYRVHCSRRTLDALPPAGVAVTLQTEMIVREDAISLVGFLDPAEADWYAALTAIQGVGSKVALGVLSALPPDDLARAVAYGDAAMVARAQGVGPKLAARIVNELKGRAPVASGLAPAAAPRAATPASEAVAALTGLGFRLPEAQRAVAEAEAELGDAPALDALIAAALRRSAR